VYVSIVFEYFLLLNATILIPPAYLRKEKRYKISSVAGHYVPQLVDLVYERNKEKKGKTYINIKGFIVRIRI